MLRELTRARIHAAVWAAYLAAGCSSSSSATKLVDAGAGMISEAAASDANSGYSLSWAVAVSSTVGIGSGGAAPSGAIPGVKVCVYGHDEIPCTTSADDGTFMLTGLPGGANLPVTLEKEGYLSVLKPIQMGRTPEATTTPISMELDDALVPDAAFAIDVHNKGTVNVTLMGATGAKLSISPPSGNGPEYINGQNVIDPTATSTLGGTTMFYNVDPGDYTLTVDDPNLNCAPANFPFSYAGYPAPPHGVSFPVLAGYLDLVGLLCLPNPTIVPTDGAAD